MSEYYKTARRKGQYRVEISILITLIALCASSCSSGNIDKKFESIQKNQLQPSGISIDYPKEGTIFPPEIPAPLVLWSDSLRNSGKWHIRISTKDGKELCNEMADSAKWRPNADLWQKIKTTSVNDPVYITIIGEHSGFLGSKYSSGRASFTISKDSVGAPIFYRAVPLPFGYAVTHVSKIEWYSGRIDGSAPKKVLDNMPVCANCHSFSQAGQVAMDVDYANDKGSYIIAQAKDTVHMTYDKIMTWSDYKKEDGDRTYGLLSQISPDGKYVLSTVKDRSVFVAVDSLDYSQLFFPIKGIIAVYDRDTKKLTSLPGASDPAFVQSNPNWSPDGKEIIFTKANRYNSTRIENNTSVLLNIEDAKEFITRQKEFKFDLYRIPFNDGKGGKAEPIPGASNNKKSNFFARYSPDGKWIVFCQAENFMLLQRDSKLFIMPASGGTPRLMNCNTHSMNSWHSWSPNSKWLVFSSKKRGPYTQLYLTHIDENGNDSPPVYLENLAFNSKAANIPEFIPPKGSGLQKMVDNFSKNAMYFTRMAVGSMVEKKYKDVLKSLDEAIKTDKNYFDAYEQRISVNLVLGSSLSKDDLRDRAIARTLIDKDIQRNPKDKALYIKRGHLKLVNKDYEGALKDGMYALKLNSNDIEGYILVSLIYQEMGKLDNAIATQLNLLKIQPENADQTQKLALLYHQKNQPGKALELLNKLIDRFPTKADYYVSRASLMANKADWNAAKSDFDKAISVEPNNYEVYSARSMYFMNTNTPDQAKADLDKAISLLSDDISANSQNAPLILKRATMMEQMGNIQGALTEYETYVKSWPVNFSALNSLARNYGAQKQWAKAIDAYNQIADNFPDRKQVLYDRGLAYAQSGNMPKALSDLNDAIRSNPKEYNYFFTRAKIKEQLGDKAGYNSDLKTTAALLSELKTKRQLNQEEQKLLSSIRK